MTTLNRTRVLDGRVKPICVQTETNHTGYKRITGVVGVYALGNYRITHDYHAPTLKGGPKRKFVRGIDVNPFNAVSVSSSCNKGQIYTRRNTQSRGGTNYSLTGEICAFEGPVPTWVLDPVEPFRPKEIEYLTAKLYAKPGNAQHEFGVSIGELGETLRMLRNPVNSLVSLTSAILDHRVSVKNLGKAIALSGPLSKAVRKTVKRVLRNGFAVIDESAGLWVQYRYGVRPLIGEIQSILNLYQSGVKQHALGQIETAKTGMEIPVIRTSVRRRSEVNGFWCDYAEDTEVTEKINMGLYYVPEWNLPNLDNVTAAGLAPWQLLGTFWELVPLSFVVDRFYDVSSFLKGLTPDPRLRFLKNWCTHTYKMKFTRVANPVYHYAYSEQLYGQAGYYEFVQSRVHRTVELPQVGLPTWNPKLLDFYRNLDHLALAWQRMPKFLR